MDIFILFISLFLLLKGKLSWALLGLILLTTSYLGVSSNLAVFPIEHNVSDTGLILYLALCSYILFGTKGKLTSGRIDKYVIAFLFFLLVSLIVDIIVNKISFISILKTSRHWIFLTCFWIFYYIPKEEIKRLINYLLYATILISIISLIEFFFGLEIIGIRQTTEMTNFGLEIQRGSIPTTFSFFYLILLFTNYFTYKRWAKTLLIFLFVTVILVSMIRSLILSVTIGLFIIIIFTGKHKVKSSIRALVTVMAVLFIVFSNPFLKDRFITGFREVNVINYNGISSKGNVSFRINHIKERFVYISQNLQYSLFGIGNVIEKDFPQIFKTGLSNKKGRTTQLDTADNAWSLMFIRLGFLGTLIYILLYIKVLMLTMQLRSISPLATTLIVYLFINLLILSFASSGIATGQFWLFPIMTYSLVQKLDETGLNSEGIINV